MKKTITKQEQQRINQLLDSRRVKEVNNLIPVKRLTKDEDICRMLQYEHDNTMGSQTGRYEMTYLQREQFDNAYNNFK